MWKDLWPDLLYMRFVTNAVVTEDVVPHRIGHYGRVR